jgi:hypothetical protein
MLTQAAGLAALAAISPTALLVAAVFLGSASPRRACVLYLAGAIVMTAVMAVIVFAVLRAGHLYRPAEHQARYGLRLGLGVLSLLGAAYVLWRSRRRPDPCKEQKEKKEGVIARMVARPGRMATFLVGVLVYSPSATFVAAVSVVASSGSDTARSLAALTFVIVITVAFVWLPLVLYLLAPERTTLLLGRFNAWLRSHGHQLLAVALAAAGVVLAVNGILGLTGTF